MLYHLSLTADDRRMLLQTSVRFAPTLEWSPRRGFDAGHDIDREEFRFSGKAIERLDRINGIALSIIVASSQRFTEANGILQGHLSQRFDNKLLKLTDGPRIGPARVNTFFKA